MSHKILVFYGSYRSDRKGIRLADWLVAQFRARGEDALLIDAKAVGLPMLDRMYKEYPKGQAPEALEALAGQIKAADAFVFVAGEYNWGVQPGLKNLTDHFLEEWFWRPAAIASYSFGRLAGTIPDGVVRVAESGVTGPADAARYAAEGADVVLVGEALVKDGEPAAAVAALKDAGART